MEMPENFKTNAEYLRGWGKERLVAEIRAAGYTDSEIIAEIARNEQNYRAEHPEENEYRDYITLNEKLDLLNRKLDDVLVFVDEIKTGIDQAANSSGMFGGLIRSFMPVKK